jgi:hypothetical protein
MNGDAPIGRDVRPAVGARRANRLDRFARAIDSDELERKLLTVCAGRCTRDRGHDQDRCTHWHQ